MGRDGLHDPQQGTWFFCFFFIKGSYPPHVCTLRPGDGLWTSYLYGAGPLIEISVNLRLIEPRLGCTVTFTASVLAERMGRVAADDDGASNGAAPNSGDGESAAKRARTTAAEADNTNRRTDLWSRETVHRRIQRAIQGDGHYIGKMMELPTLSYRTMHVYGWYVEKR